MTTALRPLTTGELLDRTFNVYRNNFSLFAGIAALAAFTLVAASVLLAVLGFALPTPGAQLDPSKIFTTLLLYFLVVGLSYLIGASLAIGATIYAVSKVHLGQPVGIGESYSMVLPSLGRIIRIVLSIILRMIGVLLLVYLVAVAIGLAVTFGLRGAARNSGSALMASLVVILVVIMILVGYGFVLRVYFKYALAVQACVLEKTDAVQSLKRSASLTKGSLWRIFLIYLLMGIIGVALSWILHLPEILLFAKNAPFPAMVWNFIATFVAVTLSFPISTIAISLLYYDQRVRKEAFDLQLMMEAIGQAPQTQAAVNPIG